MTNEYKEDVKEARKQMVKGESLDRRMQSMEVLTLTRPILLLS